MTTTPKATLKRRRLFGHLMLKTSFSLKKKIQLFISLHSYFPRIYIKYSGKDVVLTSTRS